MPNVLKRLTGARRRFERNSKYIIDDFGLIASTFKQYGGFSDPYYVNIEDEDDASSVSSCSTMATTDDNREAGWTVDKCFYQPVRRRIEKIAYQIAIPFLSPGRIFQFIEKNHFNGELDFNTYGISGTPQCPDIKTVYRTGLNSLIQQTQ